MLERGAHKSSVNVPTGVKNLQKINILSQMYAWFLHFTIKASDSVFSEGEHSVKIFGAMKI